LQPDHRWEGAANAHTAADLRVRPDSQLALNLKTVGAANDLRDSMPYLARNGFDSARVPQNSTSRALTYAMFF
jgi:uncharacterized protein (DUF934 family)